MSDAREVRQSINDMVEFMKNKINANIAESEIGLDHQTMSRISGIVDQSISQAKTLALGSVENALTRLVESESKTSKTKARKAKK